VSGVRLTAQLKCIYTNACSMGNKQEEMEAIIRQDGYDLVTVTEMWWDDSNVWSAAMDGYKLFRRDRQGKRDSGVALYVRVKMRGKAHKAHILLGGSVTEHPTWMKR